MSLETITREEFDRRLDAANARQAQELRQMEVRIAMLEALADRYCVVLDRLEAEIGAETDSSSERRADLKQVLMELAERTAAIAASLD